MFIKVCDFVKMMKIFTKKVGQLDAADSGLMPGLFSETEKRGFWMRVRSTSVIFIHV